MIPCVFPEWKPVHRTLICSLSSGPVHDELLSITAPTLVTYAHLHRMDVCLLPLGRNRIAPDRPPAWDKIPLLYRMAGLYEWVLWVDCDAIIVDPFPDILAHTAAGKPMYTTRQEMDGIPNTGVWLVRGNEEAQSLLQEIWDNEAFIHHEWWEQASLMSLMGYREPGVTLAMKPLPLMNRIGQLPNRWNDCCSSTTRGTIIKHYCGRRAGINSLMRRDLQTLFLPRVRTRLPHIFHPTAV